MVDIHISCEADDYPNRTSLSVHLPSIPCLLLILTEIFFVLTFTVLIQEKPQRVSIDIQQISFDCKTPVFLRECRRKMNPFTKRNILIINRKLATSLFSTKTLSPIAVNRHECTIHGSQQLKSKFKAF
jgi:hypothetical protein